MLDAATMQGQQLHSVWSLFLWTGLAVAAIVYGLIAWCIFRFRKPKGSPSFPPQFRRNDRMEIIYTVLPIITVAVLFAIIYPIERRVETVSDHPDLRVNVDGFRWSWRFSYPQYRVNIAGKPDQPPVLNLPLGETARLNIRSVDVDHSFWVPAFLFKRDAIPGYDNAFDWTPTKLGRFRGECGEFCGLDHATMSFIVNVETKAEFDRWIRSVRQ
jgi:cytochrome c oxidase subunit 2